MMDKGKSSELEIGFGKVRQAKSLKSSCMDVHCGITCAMTATRCAGERRCYLTARCFAASWRSDSHTVITRSWLNRDKKLTGRYSLTIIIIKILTFFNNLLLVREFRTQEFLEKLHPYSIKSRKHFSNTLQFRCNLVA